MPFKVYSGIDCSYSYGLSRETRRNYFPPPKLSRCEILIIMTPTKSGSSEVYFFVPRTTDDGQINLREVLSRLFEFNMSLISLIVASTGSSL